MRRENGRGDLIKNSHVIIEEDIWPTDCTSWRYFEFPVAIDKDLCSVAFRIMLATPSMGGFHAEDQPATSIQNRIHPGLCNGLDEGAAGFDMVDDGVQAGVLFAMP